MFIKEFLGGSSFFFFFTFGQGKGEQLPHLKSYLVFKHDRGITYISEKKRTPFLDSR